MLLDIVTGANTPVLREKAQPVTEFNDELKQLVDNMVETMLSPGQGDDVKGIGLAANQIGELQRIMIVTFNVNTTKKHKVVAMINPEILEYGKAEVSYEEGCLSLPGQYGQVTRSAKIKVRWQNVEGNWCEKKLDGWDARIFLHEYDHLEGVLFIDY